MSTPFLLKSVSWSGRWHILGLVSAPGFVLETTLTLSPPNRATVSNPPVQFGDEDLESIQMTKTNQFHRLQLPGQ